MVAFLQMFAVNMDKILILVIIFSTQAIPLISERFSILGHTDFHCRIWALFYFQSNKIFWIMWYEIKFVVKQNNYWREWQHDIV